MGALTVVLAAGAAQVAGSVERADSRGSLASGPSAGSGTQSPDAAEGQLAGELPAPSSATFASPLSTGQDVASDTAAGPAGPAVPAAPRDATPGEGEAVPVLDTTLLTPLLRTLAFGTTFAAKGVGCNLAGSLLGGVTTVLGLSDLASSAVLQGVDACVQLAATLIVVLDGLATLTTALNAIDPALDPLIEIIAANVEILGTQYADQLAPFSETIATLAPTLRYFIGDKGGAAG